MTEATPTSTAILIGTYGAIGIGKSIDMMLVDPNGYVFGPAGATMGTAARFFGPEIYQATLKNFGVITDFEELVVYVEMMSDGRLAPRNWVGDDVSTLMKTALVRLRAAYPKNKNYDYWDAVDALVNRLKVAAQRVPCVGMLNAHVYQPGTDEKGKFHKGGMDAGGPRAMETLMSILHTIYRIESDPTCWPHPVGYRCDTYDTRWNFKDRMNVIDGVGPANLREILRVHGRVIPRYPGMEWLDEVADAIAAQLKAPGADRQKIYTAFLDHLTGQGLPDHFIWWALRDGFDRAALTSRGSFLRRPLAASGSGGPGLAGLNLAPPATTTTK